MSDSLTLSYYKFIFRKWSMITILIIGAVLGGTISIYQFVTNSYILGIGFGNSWWSIPLSTLVLGPVGAVLFALILPILPYIAYIILRILIEV